MWTKPKLQLPNKLKPVLQNLQDLLKDSQMSDKPPWFQKCRASLPIVIPFTITHQVDDPLLLCAMQCLHLRHSINKKNKQGVCLSD